MNSFFVDPYNYVSKNPGSKYKYLLLFLNWFFQGYFHKDKTELLYKLIIELSIIILICYGLELISNYNISIMFIVVIFAHTINWVITGCIWCVLRPKYGLQIVKKNNNFDVDSYITRILSKFKNNRSIEACVIFGSLSNDRFHLDSDIDVAIIRHKGFLNSFDAYKLVLQERLYAFFRIIPLDILLFDSIDSFKEMADEEGVVIYHD